MTEPQYLEGFKRWCKNPRVSVEVDPNHGVPLTLVQRAVERKRQAEAEAKRAKDDNLRYDQVWCVFDIDEHPNVPQAMQLASGSDIRLAVSNPAFELWLILHFRESPGTQHRRDLTKLLRTFVAGYQKNLDFSLVQDGYFDAVARARRLDEEARAMDEEGRSPTTGVWRLTESIRGADSNDGHAFARSGLDGPARDSGTR